MSIYNRAQRQSWSPYPALRDEHRRAVGRLHPPIMSGEYLPDRRGGTACSTGSPMSTTAIRAGIEGWYPEEEQQEDEDE